MSERSIARIPGVVVALILATWALLSGSNQAAHTQYASAPANQAASFVAGLL